MHKADRWHGLLKGLGQKGEFFVSPNKRLLRVMCEKVPDSLGAALEALAADEVVRSAMPGRLYKVFHHYKRDEWERYLAAVTDWERDEYLEVLP